MPEKRRGLGRGLGALIPSSAEQQDESTTNVGTRVAERGRPVDLFFPSAGSNGSTAEGIDGDQSDPSSRSTRKSSINKEALTAPAKRTNGRNQAATKRATAAKAQKLKVDATAEAAVENATGELEKDSPSPVTPSAEEFEGSPAVEVPAEASAEDEAATSNGAESDDAVESDGNEEALEDADMQVPRETLQEVPGARFAELPIGSIHPNRKQPRTVFDEDEMAELVHSVREIGVLQPVVVRASSEGGEQGYELVMGERRWRASREAGLETVPAIIRDTTDDDLLRDALLENLHRSQLNPLEEAAAYQQLLEDFGCSQEELAVRIGRSRPQISNTLRLMKLPPLVQRRLAAGVLSAGHARALLGLSDPAEMEKLAQRIVAEGLSVRSTEEIVAMSDGLRRPGKPTAPRAGARHERLDYLATSLSDRLDTNVKITLGAKKGRVSIEFASVDDLNRIMGVLAPTS